MTAKISGKPDFARVISPKDLHRYKVVWCSSEKRKLFVHFATLKIEPYFAKSFSKFWLWPIFVAVIACSKGPTNNPRLP
jgi:hypothetical protein